MEDNKDTKVEELEKDTPEKTYTKEDIDNSFNAGMKKASKEWQKDEKYQEFMNWKKSNQTENDKINELTQNNTTLANEKVGLENRVIKIKIKVYSIIEQILQ